MHPRRCSRVCPIGLVPQQMQKAAIAKDYKRFDQLHGADCIACGSCTFICPAKRPLTQLFKIAKAAVLAERRKEAGK